MNERAGERGEMGTEENRGREISSGSVCVCVCLRETESEGGTEKKIDKESERENAIPARGDVTFVVYARL